MGILLRIDESRMEFLSNSQNPNKNCLYNYYLECAWELVIVAWPKGEHKRRPNCAKSGNVKDRER